MDRRPLELEAPRLMLCLPAAPAAAAELDWSVISADETSRMYARYDFRTDSGAVVGVINEGIHCFGAPDEPTTIGPEGIAIITRPRFEASADAPDWLNSGAFAGVLRLHGPAKASVEVFRLDVQP